MDSRRINPARPQRLVGSKANVTLESYAGAIVSGSPVQVAMSPDGNLVLSGSEDGEACVWQAQSQRRVTTPGLLVGFDTMCVPVAWHPKQHLIAVSSFGTDHPILLYANESAIEHGVAQSSRRHRKSRRKLGSARGRKASDGAGAGAGAGASGSRRSR